MLLLRKEDAVAHVVLARPLVRNAFNAELIAELHSTFTGLATDDAIRVVVIAGEGKTFCGGADVTWMRGSLELSHDENVEDARRLSRMLRAIDTLDKLVIGRIQGAALGGGAGLAAVCDIAIAAGDAVFGFTETRLGILPAVISPFVLAKIGRSQARAYCLNGARFSAQRALEIGLVHRLAPDGAPLDAAVEEAIADALAASPAAIATTKALLRTVAQTPYDDTLDLTAHAIAAARVSPQGQEGLRAFLEKRAPNWQR